MSAICAAPSVLKEAGVLDGGVKHTCHFSVKEFCRESFLPSEKPYVVDSGNLFKLGCLPYKHAVSFSKQETRDRGLVSRWGGRAYSCQFSAILLPVLGHTPANCWPYSRQFLAILPPVLGHDGRMFQLLVFGSRVLFTPFLAIKTAWTPPAAHTLNPKLCASAAMTLLLTFSH